MTLIQDSRYRIIANPTRGWLPQYPPWVVYIEDKLKTIGTRYSFFDTEYEAKAWASHQAAQMIFATKE